MKNLEHAKCLASEAESEERLARIAHMEDLYDRGCEAVEDLLRAAQRYLSVIGEIKALEAYYASDAWMEDFEADRAGRIPKDMKRGILTEDAIFDLLTDQDRLRRILKKLSEPEEGA